MEFSYNLLDNEWIPVLPKDGSIRDVSLRELLLRAHEFREIAHDSPAFNASMLMLCISLLQSAWPGETFIERDDEWTTTWERGHLDSNVLNGYFERWKDRFDLFHPHFPFYQVGGMEMGTTSSIRRLAIAEHNGGIFANKANFEWSRISPALAAQFLVAIQSYVVGLGIASNVKIDSVILEVPRLTGGVLMSGLTIWPSGESLFETLLLNSVPHELKKKDAPCWELDEPHLLRDTLLASDEGNKKDKSPSRRVIAPFGICDLLTLQTRMIRLLPKEVDGITVVPSVYFSQGRSIENSKDSATFFHPFKLYEKNGKTGFNPLSLSESKAIWRNSSCIFSRERTNRDVLSTLSFVARQTEDNVLDKDFSIGLNVVGVAVNPKNPASLLLWRHDRLPIPVTLLTDPNAEPRVQSALEDANNLVKEMRGRFSRIAELLLSPERLKKAEIHKPDQKNVRALVDKYDPEREFWPLLENYFLDFLKELSTDHEKARAKWRNDIERAAHDCFHASCKALGNGPNAVVAVAQVSQWFSLEDIHNRSIRTGNRKTNKAT